MSNGAMILGHSNEIFKSSIKYQIDNGSNYFALASTVAVPADATLVLIDKNSSIYLDETDLLRIVGSAAGDLVYVVSGEILDDA